MIFRSVSGEVASVDHSSVDTGVAEVVSLETLVTVSVSVVSVVESV